jgi:[ribosomal protein S5]-alanine N-acetyltransferase
MALLRLDFSAEVEPRLESQAVYLRRPRPADHAEWAALRAASAAYLRPWEPQWADDELSRRGYRRRLRRYAEDMRAGLAAPFFIFDKADGALVGGVNVSNIRRGVAQDCSVGYWIGQAHAGRGLMTEAMRLVIGHCFDDLGLHRIQAACIPDNAASRRVLTKLGFTEEGRARAYLKIAGAWRDHVLYGLVRGDPVG